MIYLVNKACIGLEMMSQRSGLTFVQTQTSNRGQNKICQKTGGGPADAELTPLEEKIHSIRGTETFEGISCGIDVSAEPQSSQLSDQMLTSPSVPFDGAVSRKRKHPRLVTSIEIDDTKRILIAKEDEKLALLR